MLLCYLQQYSLKSPCGIEPETFPLLNDPDRETITADLQGTSKLDIHLDLCLRLSAEPQRCRECSVPGVRKLQFLLGVRDYTATKALTAVV